jgi:peptidoglycan/LPS O-acetylase OafA/YrhL
MKHVAPLDGMRAIAAGAVLMCHAGGASHFGGGYLGVDMFFALSGFLITAILADEHDSTGTVAVGRFYMRRLFRLMPALLLLLAVYLALAPLVWSEFEPADHAQSALIAGLYLSDYAYTFWHVPHYIRHTWSLAVEEHYYLLWPPVLLLLLRAKSPARVAMTIYLVAALWRLANFMLLDFHDVYYRFDTRFAGILLGSWLALWLRENGLERVRQLGRLIPSLALALIVMLFITVRWDHWAGGVVGMPMVEWLSVLLIVAILQQQAAPVSSAVRLLATKPAAFLGKLSYGIYLWHMPMATLTKNSMPFLASTLVCFVFATGMAWISWHTVEKLGRNARARMDQARVLA